MTLIELNDLDQAGFVAAVGWVFEHSPWVAARAWADRPFQTVDQLHGAMTTVMRSASRDEQLALLRAHPDLGTRVTMTVASAGEQAGAGLHQLADTDLEHLRRLNADYRAQFGFPFLLAVKGATAPQILESLARRVRRTPDEEWSEALAQVARIARFRLDGMHMS